MTQPRPHQPNARQDQQHPDPEPDDEHDDVPRDEHGRQEPEHDDGHGLPHMVYTAEHTYHEDAHGDHLVRVVSPVGVFAEFIGTPGAELVILTPPQKNGLAPKEALPLQAHVKYKDPDHPPQQVTAQADWRVDRPQVATIGNSPGIGNQGVGQSPGSSEPTKGVLTGRNKGQVRVTATFGGLRAEKTVVVANPTGRSLTIDTPSGHPNVKKGQKLPLRSSIVLDGGRTQLVTNQTRWESSNPRVATVSPTGEVTGVQGGDAVITGTYGNEQEGQKPVMAKVHVTVEFDGKDQENKKNEDKPEQNESGKGSENGENSGSDKGNKPDPAGQTPDGEDQDTSDKGQTPSQGSNEGQGESTPSEGSAEQAPSAGEAPQQGGGAEDGGVQPQYTQ